MLQRTCRRASNYILSERLVVDWWQPFYRDDAHKKAKTYLQDALALVDTAPHATEQPLESPAYPAGGPSLYELNALVATFTAAHNVEDLSIALQYVHEQLGQELTPFHYHALLRAFSYQYDRDSALQLLAVMAQRGDMTLETYARVMDLLHSLGPQDVLPRLLRVVALAQSRFDTLRQALDAAGSESATAAAFGPGEAFERAVADSTVMPGEAHQAEWVDATAANSATPSASPAPPCTESPVLRALLHHVANSGTCSPVAALLVVVWMRALGASLSEWDVALVLSALLVKPEDFPRVRAVTGYFADSARGSVRPQAFLDRLAERGELSPASSPLSVLSEAMRASLATANVDLSTPVYVGVVNAQTTGLPALVDHILDLAEASNSSRRRCGTSLREADDDQVRDFCIPDCDTTAIAHYVMLLHGTVRSYTAAAQTLHAALRRHSDTTAANAADAADEPSSSPANVDCHFLMDGGALLPSTSATQRETLSRLYRGAVRRVAQKAREDALHEATQGALPTPSSLAARVPNLGAPLRRPTLADANNCEGYALLFVNTTAEARQALANLTASIEPGTARLSRTTRFAFRQLAHYCTRHPRANSKMTETGLAERRKWARYLDARDTALNLFGSAQRARDVMRQLFYEDAAMPALRSPEVVTRDVSDMTQILFPGLARSAARAVQPPPPPAPSVAPTTVRTDGTETALTEVEATALFVQHTIVEPRATVPHVRCAADVVPPCLYEPHLYNPYPHVMLSLPLASATTPEEAASSEEDFFAELWQAVVNPTASGHGDLHWYVQDTDMYLLLLRCLVHRLDWEAAVHLTTRMMAHNTYTHRMDHEITQMFSEAGDPSGFLAFKVATKLFDGRILRDGQGRRSPLDPMDEM